MKHKSIIYCGALGIYTIFGLFILPNIYWSTIDDKIHDSQSIPMLIEILKNYFYFGIIDLIIIGFYEVINYYRTK